jgi:hypothetical protein
MRSHGLGDLPKIFAVSGFPTRREAAGGNRERRLLKLVKQRNQRFMEEEKRKMLEARLNLLFAEIDQPKGSDNPEKKEVHGTRLIRRRKGNPDKHIA